MMRRRMELAQSLIKQAENLHSLMNQYRLDPNARNAMWDMIRKTEGRDVDDDLPDHA
jgi:ABC-type multidrug transport system ATPase subunit